MMAYRIFVSHVWKTQHNLYWDLMRLLGGAKRLRIIDLSVPKFRPFGEEYEQWKLDIYAALHSADVVLVINTSTLDKSDAVRDELREAEARGIPVIAINPPQRQRRKPF